MPDNYYDTARRCHTSSHKLHQQNEFHSACYLGGYTAECYAKIILTNNGSSTEELRRNFGHNMERMANRISYLFESSSLVNENLINIAESIPTILRGENKWNPVAIRYIAHSEEWDQETSSQYLSEIDILMEALTRMKTNGEI